MSDAGIDIRILDKALDTEAAIKLAWGAGVGGLSGVGGVCSFIGITRGDVDGERGAIERLDYACYPEMALQEMRRLAAEAPRGRWPVVRAVLWHRVGSVAVGEASVVIAVGCPHRGEAFDACRYLIDELKSRVPIWKKDVYSSGEKWQSEGG